jgi:hypothetical protein
MRRRVAPLDTEQLLDPDALASVYYGRPYGNLRASSRLADP